MIFKTKTIQVQQIKPGIVELLFCAPDSPNTLDVRTIKSLAKSLNIIKQFENLQGVIIRSDQEHFLTSTNLYEYPYLFSYPTIELRAWINHVKHLFWELENFPVPTVCVIQGACMAEGCELALTSDFRISDASAQIGLPQIKFGLIPGFGGSILLPRVIGMKHAIPLIVKGSIINAEMAKEIQLIDKVCKSEDLLETAIQQLETAIQAPALWQQRRQTKQQPIYNSENATTIVNEQQRLWKNLNRHYVAPFSAISLLADTWQIQREHALVQETNHYITLAKTNTSKNLIHNYLNEQRIKHRHNQATAERIQQAAVLGSSSIAIDLCLHIAARHIRTFFSPNQSSSNDYGIKAITSRLEQLTHTQQLNDSARNSLLHNISSPIENQDMGQLDIVLEALTEKIEIKQKVLQEIEDKLKPESILTTNTSCTSITHLGQKLRRPQQFCALHFFSPLSQIPLVEIVRTAQTTDDTLNRVRAFAVHTGFTPIVVQDTPGFFINRITASYLSALFHLIEQKVDIERIDRVMNKLGWRIGPATLVDLLGLDKVSMMLNHLHHHFPNRIINGENSVLQRSMETSRYGYKSGCGLYDYNATEKHKSPLLEELYPHPNHLAISNQEIEQRLMFALCNEVIHCLDEGVIESHEDADIALIHALGFPRYLGGPLQYIDDMGLDTYLEQLKAYAGLSDQYQPPAGLVARTDKNQYFYHQPDVRAEHIFN